MALKLHRQFGHTTAEKLKGLVRNANIKSSNLEYAIDQVTSNCTICKKYRKPNPRPVVSVPMAHRFNEVIAMDLKSWGDKYFLVIVDLYTRYCTALVISDKSANTVIRGVFLSWIVIFGSPGKILSDNGMEFNNDCMRDLGEAFNIKVMTTAAESPWSNGVCERLNAVLGRMVQKILADCPNTDLNIALAWAVAARNSLATFSGFSPNQLVFSQNPGIPGVFYDRLPALEKEKSSADIIRNNLNALHSARRAFTQAESSERLARALRHNVRESDTGDLQCGSEVYYKRMGSNEWRGPGTIIGKEGKQFLVKHGGVYVRVHSCRLTDASTNVATTDSTENDFTSSDDVCENMKSDQMNNYESDSEDDYKCEETTIEEHSNAVSDNSQVLGDASITMTPKVKIKIGQRIKGIDKTSGEWVSGRIVSRAGKATGKYPNCYNMKHDSDGNISWVNLDCDFLSWETVDDNTEMLVLFNTDEVMSAKENEIENWKRNDVYEEVDDVGQKTLSVRWVVTEKIKKGKTIVKARLVARGFEEDTLDFKKDSPTCSKEAVRLALALASVNGWKCHTMDIKAAYLQGKKIDREVYLRPPTEFDNGSLWRLKKTVYGLCDAARQWYMSVKDQLIILGAVISALEPALFSWNCDGKIEGVMCVYVDDFLWAGTKKFEKKIIMQMYKVFQVGSSNSGCFKYVGLNIVTNEDGSISVDQHQYGASLKSITISKQRAAMKNSDLSEKERSEYRGLVGQLNWMATQTRPDIAFDVCELSMSFSKATVLEMLRLEKVIARVKNDPIRIHMSKMKPLNECHLECYSDASFANLQGHASQGGFIIFLCDTNSNRCPIFWQSRKIRRVVKSTLAAEALALLDGASAAVYLSNILQEISGCNSIPIKCFVDNQSLVEALSSYKMVDDRRLRIDISVLKNMLENEELKEVSWIDTSKQLADCLTKRGASCEKLRAAVSCNYY